ncbi:MAG: hypothetical protein NTW21_26015 [Verrucomicrobia bacterium]|nr:hypothetical protein [Verrucomicrobiota bacterium]
MKSHLASNEGATDPVTGQGTVSAAPPVAGEVTGQVTGQVEAQEAQAEAQASLIPTEICGERLPQLLEDPNEPLAA